MFPQRIYRAHADLEDVVIEFPSRIRIQGYIYLVIQIDFVLICSMDLPIK